MQHQVEDILLLYRAIECERKIQEMPWSWRKDYLEYIFYYPPVIFNVINEVINK